MARFTVVFLTAMLLNSHKALCQLSLSWKLDTSGHNINIRVLPQNFYTQHLGFFCKKEVQIQKLTAVPVYIRLGSKEYVDYLERKPNMRRDLRF